jgi:exopolysaccharide biosynthesis predicted pyruvyltransferase EpsI
MSDPYLEAIQQQWPNIQDLYSIYENERPIILYDIQEKKIYAYPYKEFRAELSKKSQESLKRDYKFARSHGSMVVFVRDNLERRLVSYTMSTDGMPHLPQ